jgi:hypothetical protein
MGRHDVVREFRDLVGSWQFPTHWVQAIPEVTLICADCVDPQLGAYALALSMRGFRWGSVKLFSDRRPDWMPTGAEWVPIPKLTSLNAYNLFTLLTLHKYVDTQHVLTVQSDGWVLRPDLWDFDWLEWDYIGAPWVNGHFAGNSGFCLRSSRLLRSTANLAPWVLQEHLESWGGRVLDDTFTCIQFRQRLAADGLMFAPNEVAARFAIEQKTPWHRGETFGFHDWQGQKKPIPRLRWLSSHVRELGESLRAADV